MNYNHFNISERTVIAQLLTSGYNIRQIAKVLDRNPSTISRDIRRNSYKTSKNYSVTRYTPSYAQKKYEERKKTCGRKVLADQTVLAYIKNTFKNDSHQNK